MYAIHYLTVADVLGCVLLIDAYEVCLLRTVDVRWRRRTLEKAAMWKYLHLVSGF